MYYEISEKERALRTSLRKVDKVRKCLDAVRILVIEGYNIDGLGSKVAKNHNDAVMNLHLACAEYNK